MRHTERNVAETGLTLLNELVNSFSESEFNNQFFQQYYLSLIQEIFAVLTDTFHKPGFKFHALILQKLFALADGDGPVVISVPLWDVAALGPSAFPSNGAFVRQHVTQLLTGAGRPFAHPLPASKPTQAKSVEMFEKRRFWD